MPENNVIDSPEVHITELSSLDVAAEPTSDLEQTKEQLRKLSGAMYSSEGNDEAKVKEALAELLKPDGLKMETVKIAAEAKDEAPAPATDAPPALENKDSPTGNAPATPAPLPVDLVFQTTKATTEVGDGLQVNSASAEPPVAASQLPADLTLQAVLTAPAEGDKKAAPRGGDMFSRIFNKEEEQENPLAALMASLPNPSLNELMEEAREVEGMLGQWQQG